MRELLTTKQFKKDLKRVKKRGKSGERLQAVLNDLVAGIPLDPRYKPHRLVGNWTPCWECHIEPDWLLIWDEDDTSVILIRTGTHADLFE